MIELSRVALAPRALPLSWEPALSSPTVLASLVLALALLAGAVASWWLRTQLERWRRQRRAACAIDGERAAARLLERAGYAILGEQVVRNWLVNVDGQSLAFQLRVDYVVQRAGQVFVADAKTGELASSIRHPATRRQLLEYSIAYRADGALLVDMEARRIQLVRFPELDG